MSGARWIQQVEWPVVVVWDDTAMGSFKFGIDHQGYGGSVEDMLSGHPWAEGLRFDFTKDLRMIGIEVDGWAPQVFPAEARRHMPEAYSDRTDVALTAILQRSSFGDAYVRLSSAPVATSVELKDAYDDAGAAAEPTLLVMDFDSDDSLVGLRFSGHDHLPHAMVEALSSSERIPVPEWWGDVRLPIEDLQAFGCPR